MLYVRRRNEWIGGGIDRYGCVHNDSQEAKVMLGTKLQWKKTIYNIHSQSEACIKGHGHSIR